MGDKTPNQETWKIAANRRLSYKWLFTVNLHPNFHSFVDFTKFWRNQINIPNQRGFSTFINYTFQGKEYKRVENTFLEILLFIIPLRKYEHDKFFSSLILLSSGLFKIIANQYIHFSRQHSPVKLTILEVAPCLCFSMFL